MTTEPALAAPQLSLATRAARTLATTAKTTPQMRGITPRWLLRTLPWVTVRAGTYRVNRRLVAAVGRDRVRCVPHGADDVRIVPATLRALPALRGFADEAVLGELAARFSPRHVAAGETVAEAGAPVAELLVVAHARLSRWGSGAYDRRQGLGVLVDGDQLGEETLRDAATEAAAGETAGSATWRHTVRADTSGTLMVLPRAALHELLDRFPALADHLRAVRDAPGRPVNKRGEADIAVAAGHRGEPTLPGTFADYELAPREFELSVTQTILRVHSRVADLYNDPMSQFEEQLRLTVESVRERQEWEMLNNREFGLLHNAAYEQRIATWSGPPTPDDLDALLAMRRKTRLLLAHPRAIAAFFRECNRRGVYPATATVEGSAIPAWRGVPMFPCDKIPVTAEGTSSILAMRTGEKDQGVVGLHQTGIPDEYQPGLNVRFMGISEKAIVSYLVSAYYSAAVLVPDALGVLEHVEVA